MEAFEIIKKHKQSTNYNEKLDTIDLATKLDKMAIEFEFTSKLVSNNIARELTEEEVEEMKSLIKIKAPSLALMEEMRLPISIFDFTTDQLINFNLKVQRCIAMYAPKLGNKRAILKLMRDGEKGMSFGEHNPNFKRDFVRLEKGNKFYKLAGSDVLLMLVEENRNDLNLYVECTDEGVIDIQYRSWYSRPIEQHRLVRGFEKLERAYL